VGVKVQPKSRRPGLRGVVSGPDGMLLRVDVSVAAQDGKANAAVCLVLAKAMQVPVAAVSVVLGASSRQKLLAIMGDPALLASRFADPVFRVIA